MPHRTRDLLIRQRTMISNALRAHLAEFGIIEKLGSSGLEDLVLLVENKEDERIPAIAREALLMMVGQIRDTHTRVSEIEKQIHAWHRASEMSRRLETIPGIGPIIASAIAATVTDPSVFASGRQLSAWLGLVPRQHSSGGKERLRDITKQGNPYIRRLLIIGATAVLRFSRRRAPTTEWTAVAQPAPIGAKSAEALIAAG